MENQKALAKIETGQDVVVLFEQHAMAMSKIMEVAFKNTLPSDWVNFGGKAWLDGPGAERIGRALGLTIKDWTWKKMDLKDDIGEHYYIICEGKVGHKPLDLWVDCIGICWSRKPFWWKSGQYTKHIGEIDMGDIIKDAYTDMERNGITRLLGLRGISWEDLKKYNITQDKAQQVQFETGKRGGKKPTSPQPAIKNKLASPEQARLLARMACKKVIGQTEIDIMAMLPGILTTDHLNELLKYITDAQPDISMEDWTAKVKEVLHD